MKVGKPTQANVRALTTRGATATRRGVLTATKRLGRGLAALVPVLLAWLNAAKFGDLIINAKDEASRSRYIVMQRQAAAEARGWALIWVLGAAGIWCVSLALHLAVGPAIPVMPLVIAVPLALTAAIAANSGGKPAKGSSGQAAPDHRGGPWRWVLRLVVVELVAVGAQWLYLAEGVSPWLMRGVLVLLVVGFIVCACADEDPSDNLPQAERIKDIGTIDTSVRDNRIIAGLSEKLGIKADAEQFKIVGVGLQPVDAIWSKMTIKTPGTITTQQVVEAVPGLASYLNISAERIDAVGVDDGAGREIEGVVDIWIAHGDPWGSTPEWPLLNAERASVWKPVPFLVTGKGHVVNGLLLFAAWLLVSKPRHGKTFAMRLLALAAALDPGCDIAVFDFKVGGRDWQWARPIAVASGYGPSDDTIKAFVDYLKSVIARAEEMGRLFQALPAHLVPNGQLTAQACAYEKRLRPLVIFVDEVHQALMHPKFGKEATWALSKIDRELPFLGVNTYIASQRADVRTSIPSEICSLAANRVAGKLFKSRDSGDVLGDGANEAGYNAKHLRPIQGLFIVHGADDTSSFDGYTKGRAYLVDNLQAAEIADRAYELRRAAGVLPSQETAGPPPEKLIAALEIVRASGQPSMRSEDLAARLDTTAQRLLAEIGVKSRQEPTDGYRKHVRLADLDDAVRRHGRPLRVVS